MQLVKKFSGQSGENGERVWQLTYVPFALNTKRSIIGQADELKPPKEYQGPFLSVAKVTRELTTLYVCFTSLGVLRLGRWRMLLRVALRCLSFSRGS